MLKCPRGQAPGAPEALYSVRIITHCSKHTDLLLTCLYLLSLHWSVTTFTLLKGTLKFRELSGLRPRTRARPEPGTRCAGSQPSARPASGQPLGSGPTPTFLKISPGAATMEHQCFTVHVCLLHWTMSSMRARGPPAPRSVSGKVGT